MLIKIKPFSSARTACGFSEKNFDIKPGSSIEILMKQLYIDYPDLALMKDRLLFAVNEEYRKLPEILKDGDVLSIFPPVSGG